MKKIKPTDLEIELDLSYFDKGLKKLFKKDLKYKTFSSVKYNKKFNYGYFYYENSDISIPFSIMNGYLSINIFLNKVFGDEQMVFNINRSKITLKQNDINKYLNSLPAFFKSGKNKLLSFVLDYLYLKSNDSKANNAKDLKISFHIPVSSDISFSFLANHHFKHHQEEKSVEILLEEDSIIFNDICMFDYKLNSVVKDYIGGINSSFNFDDCTQLLIDQSVINPYSDMRSIFERADEIININKIISY